MLYILTKIMSQAQGHLLTMLQYFVSKKYILHKFGIYYSITLL